MREKCIIQKHIIMLKIIHQRSISMGNIKDTVAMQIVIAISQVVEKDINFINKEGIIIASTNEKRIGTFHEIGYKVVKSKETMMIDKDDVFEGTRKGINYPIIIDQQVIGVIGITGEPKKLMKYGFLASKITEIFIKEDQLMATYESRKKLIQHMMNKCIYEKDIVQFEEMLNKLNIKASTLYHCVVIEIKKKNVDIISIENRLLHIMDQYHIEFYMYHYPKRFIIFLGATRFKDFERLLQEKQDDFKELLNCGIGDKYPIKEMKTSYEEAMIALKYALHHEQVYKSCESLDIEILLEQVPHGAKEKYMKKILQSLTKEEIDLLQVYYKCQMSLKDVAEQLYIHKNTVQYRLDKITEKVGLNPRVFEESIRLYLALYMKGK